MSKDCREMWALLYNMVLRNDDMEDVFNAVGDILCQDPSLISHFKNENRLQDTCILWLVNRFFGWLNRSDGTTLKLKNLTLQKKILTSCLEHCIRLYKILLEAYFDTVTELAIQMEKKNRAPMDYFELKTFLSNDNCLQEIDPDFRFDQVLIRWVDCDERLNDTMVIILHAFDISYEYQKHTFTQRLSAVSLVINNSYFETKLLGFEYFLKFFSRCSNHEYMVEFLRLCVSNLSTLWLQLPHWIGGVPQIIAEHDVLEFLTMTARIMRMFSTFVRRIERKSGILNSCVYLLSHVLLCAWTMERQNGEFNFCGVINAICDFLILLVVKDENDTVLQESPFFQLMAAAENEPLTFRLLGCVAGNEKSPLVPYILLFINAKIHNLLVSATETLNMNTLASLAQSIGSLMFVEYQRCLRSQITALKTGSSVDVVTVKCPLPGYEVFRQLDAESSHNWPHTFNAQLKLFMEKVMKSKTILMIEVVVVLSSYAFRSSTVRQILSDDMQRQMIEAIEWSLRFLLQSENLASRFHQELDLARMCLKVICNIHVDRDTELFSNLKGRISRLLATLFASAQPTECIANFRMIFCEQLPHLIYCGLVSREELLHTYLQNALNNPFELSWMLRSIYCSSGSCLAFMRPPYEYIGKSGSNNLCSIVLHCCKCSVGQCTNADVLEYMRENSVLALELPNHLRVSAPLPFPSDYKLTLCKIMLRNENLFFMGHHLDLTEVTGDDWLQALMQIKFPSSFNWDLFSFIVADNSTKDETFLMRISQLLLKQTKQSLLTGSEPDQICVLQLLTCCTTNTKINERWLFHFFKLSFFYLLHPNSKVVQEAVVCATAMCAYHQVQPIQLWNWYRHDALALVVKLMLNVYLSKGIRLTRSLKAFTKMLGFSCVQEFVCKYNRLLITMLLPYCVREPQCKGLIVGISKMTCKPIEQMFVSSFLRIYSYIYLNEKPAIANQCLDLVLKCTSCSLNKLMNADVKQTVSEFLIYFNRNPQLVMQAFQCLLLQDKNLTSTTTSSSATTSSALSLSSSSLPSPNSEFAKFIADRFLGIITYFENCLAEVNFEKPLKEEALYSLGQIIRFVGAQNVTQFRFKIIAMLSFVLSLNDRDLQNLCLRIWNIFLHIVNIQELGPSLSRIVASLQPLLEHNSDEVNAIYKYLIVDNDSLLSVYIPDLYFLEDMPRVSPAIRQRVAHQTATLRGDKSSVQDKLRFLHKQISNENLQVRIYGFSHLRQFIASHRLDVNRMILHEIRVDPLLKKVIDILVVGCRHEDRNLQLASAKCVGELGAVDPSYLPQNCIFGPRDGLPLSVHTDDFAVMALTELCRAYQFQRDTKYVDNFSLAIQETLAVCGVSPKEGKKCNVWEAIPERMRQIMEPLLTSCYTSSRRQSRCKEHPLFGSSSCRSYEEWAFAWVSRLVDCIQAEETKHLLSSYKLSMKRNNNTLALFFPYVLLHALQDCNDDQFRQAYEEFETVFLAGSRRLTPQPEYEVSGYKEFLSTKYSADRSTESQGRRSNTSTEQYDALENFTRNCTKLCSEQIDFLYRWQREYERLHSGDTKAMDDSSDQRYLRIRDFLNKFDKLLVARANFQTGEFARALMYVEQFIEAGDVDNRLQEQMSLLIEIHGQLMDSDSVEGAVFMTKANLTLAEEIRVNRLIDRPQEMITRYEQLMSSNEPITQDDIKGMIQCYLRLDTPETALLITDGLWQKLSDQYTDDYFKECKSELLWRLGRYDDLQELLEDSVVRRKVNNWSIQCAEAFLLFRQTDDTDLERFSEQLDVIRGNVLSSMRSCSGVKQNSYSHSYDEVVKLHLLNEVEKTKMMLHGLAAVLEIGEEGNASKTDQSLREVGAFFDDWDARLSVVQPVVRVMEPILCFRRNLLVETKRLMEQRIGVSAEANPLCRQVGQLIDNEIGKLWMRSVQMHRDVGGLQQAQICIMKAEQYKPQSLFIEKVKLLWEKGDQTTAFKMLDENIERMMKQFGSQTADSGSGSGSGSGSLNGSGSGSGSAMSDSERSLYGEAKYLQALYNAEAMNICSDLNVQYFKEAIAHNLRSEKCHVQLAWYLDKIYASLSKEHKDGEKGRNILFEIMLNFAKSLKCGQTNMYQSLPRLLSLWLDYTSHCVAISENAHNSRDKQAVEKVAVFNRLAKKMNDLLQNCANALPTAIFYTALSQLLSRICHPSPDVFNVINSIVIKLLEKFPHQSLWMLLPIFKSNVNRSKRCNMIFGDKRLAKPQFQKLLKDFNMLADRLIELTNREVSADCTLSSLIRQLPQLFANEKFSQILLPFEKYMQVSFPVQSASGAFNLSGSSIGSSEQSIPSNPFPYAQIFITGINEEVIVLRSAAKPKKISLRCSDGREYSVMVKPKDDLRKDFRLMEFNGLVKRYLHQDSQARHRRLRIRTYAVIPFNDECGLIEWLPNLNSFRNICTTFYRSRGLGVPDHQLRKFAPAKTDSLEQKRKLFTDRLLAVHPPVFHEWFCQRFPTPLSWYEARSAYVKTIAVMSMVGYILGLGDRHGENILFDEKNGDAVHVDFNCLFNQGESFPVPELVPFRLTHNMVFAMGPLRVEGLFRKCCEITLRVLQHESKTLMSVLRPFVYDSVVLHRNLTKKLGAELIDPKATLDVRRIEERLQGYVNKSVANSMPLSVEGQVNFLIAEATNIDNLAQMYVGWGPFL